MPFPRLFLQQPCHNTTNPPTIPSMSPSASLLCLLLWLSFSPALCPNINLPTIPGMSPSTSPLCLLPLTIFSPVWDFFLRAIPTGPTQPIPILYIGERQYPFRYPGYFLIVFTLFSNDYPEMTLSDQFSSQLYNTNQQYGPSSLSGHTEECNSSISSHPSTHYSSSQRPTVHINLLVPSVNPMSATECSTPPSSVPPETPESRWSMGGLHVAHGHEHEEWPVDPRYSASTSECLEGFLVPVSPGSGFDGRTAPFKERVASPSVQGIAHEKRKKDATFFCSFCPDTFTAKHNLTSECFKKIFPIPIDWCSLDHENSHKGLKPFRCSFCGSEFGHSRSKTRHENKSCRHRQGCVWYPYLNP